MLICKAGWSCEPEGLHYNLKICLRGANGKTLWIRVTFRYVCFDFSEVNKNKHCNVINHQKILLYNTDIIELYRD